MSDSEILQTMTAGTTPGQRSVSATTVVAATAVTSLSSSPKRTNNNNIVEHSGDDIINDTFSTPHSNKSFGQREKQTTLNPPSTPRRPSISPIARPRRASTALPSTPTLSTCTPDSPEDRPRTSPPFAQITSPVLSTSSASYFALRSNGSGSELRSPKTKRPPASRSSHGIETSSGPPPALSTQRSQSSETTWKSVVQDDPAPSYPRLTPGALADLNAANKEKSSAPSTVVAKFGNKGRKTRSLDHRIEPSALGIKVDGHVNGIGAIEDHKVEASMEKERKRLSYGGEKRHSRRLSGQFSYGAEGAQEGNSQPPQEDLFLNLANTDAGDDGVVDGSREQRRSRIALPSHRQSLSHRSAESRAAQSSLPVSRDKRSSLQKLEMISQVRTPPSTDKRDRPYAASAHPLDQRSSNRLSGLHRLSALGSRKVLDREASPESPNVNGRRSSIPDSQGYQSRAYRSSHLQQAANGHYNSSPLAARHNSMDQNALPAATRADETESIVSARAPSLYWDEIDNIKSRIRMLELAENPPGSSGVAAANPMERPYTATTTTTVSSSPKRPRGQSTSPLTSIFDGDETVMHPLLGSAVAKSKAFVSAEIYRALEATAYDALTLAKTTNSTSAASSGTAPSASDRQLKRKADSLCRSLTELCIALTDSKGETAAEQSRARPGSRDAVLRHRRESSVEEARFSRAASLEPEPSISTRALSRLQARRNSIANGSNRGSGETSPARDTRDQHAEAPTPTQAALNRTSALLQRIRNSGGEDESDNTIRPLSRAMTDLGRTRPITTVASKRMSREYTSQHPLPSPESRTQGAQVLTTQSSLPARRSYLSNTSTVSQQQQPSPPNAASALGQRRYLDRNSGERAGQAEARQQRLASLGQYPRTVGPGSVAGGRLERRPVSESRVDGGGESLD